MIPLLESCIGFCVGALLLFVLTDAFRTSDAKPEPIIIATVLEVLNEEVLLRSESGEIYRLPFDVGTVFHTRWETTEGPSRLSVITGILEPSDSSDAVLALDREGTHIVRTIISHASKP